MCPRCVSRDPSRGNKNRGPAIVAVATPKSSTESASVRKRRAGTARENPFLVERLELRTDVCEPKENRGQAGAGRKPRSYRREVEMATPSSLSLARAKRSSSPPGKRR